MGCKAENIININRIKSSDVIPSFAKTSEPPIHNNATPMTTPKVSVIGGAILLSLDLRNIKL